MTAIFVVLELSGPSSFTLPNSSSIDSIAGSVTSGTTIPSIAHGPSAAVAADAPPRTKAATIQPVTPAAIERRRFS